MHGRLGQRRQRAGKSLTEAYKIAVQFTGKVVALVGITLAAGVITWAWSPIKFQADMGILLTFIVRLEHGRRAGADPRFVIFSAADLGGTQEEPNRSSISPFALEMRDARMPARTPGAVAGQSRVVSTREPRA